VKKKKEKKDLSHSPCVNVGVAISPSILQVSNQPNLHQPRHASSELPQPSPTLPRLLLVSHGQIYVFSGFPLAFPPASPSQNPASNNVFSVIQGRSLLRPAHRFLPHRRQRPLPVAFSAGIPAPAPACFLQSLCRSQTHRNPTATMSLRLSPMPSRRQPPVHHHNAAKDSSHADRVSGDFFLWRRRRMFGNWICFILIQVCRFSYSSLGICYPCFRFLNLYVFGEYDTILSSIPYCI
jgi:hypothetical protein